MATRTQPDQRNIDEFGIERTHTDEPGVVDKIRKKSEWIDHIMRMQERYASMGGNQYSAGITYFSVLALLPILMLVIAAISTVLANNPNALDEIQSQVSANIEGELGDIVNDILVAAIEQRGAIAGIGAITALWSGLGWMNNLRYGVSKMWKVDPTVVGNFVTKKIADLLGLIGLLLALVVAFAITAVGASGQIGRASCRERV